MNNSFPALYLVLFFIAVSQLLFCPAARSGNSPASDTATENILFAIGVVDRSSRDFTNPVIHKVDEYECTVGVDCSTEAFPGQLHITSTPIDERVGGVSSVKINFSLSQPYENLFLRLARSGTEAAIVTLDDDKNFKVTGKMLGSDENPMYGSYDLAIGSLDQGAHNIRLTIDEESDGNGVFWWDAIILFSLVD